MPGTSIDIHGHRSVTDFAGNTLNETRLAVREETNFTPSVVFYSTDGEEVLRLRGYYPPYRFRAALEYIADGHHRNEPFHECLARADLRWSLSLLTLAHGLARVLFIEQLYRAWCLASGHPYHRA